MKKQTIRGHAALPPHSAVGLRPTGDPKTE
jgi:hypothetical protein